MTIKLGINGFGNLSQILPINCPKDRFEMLNIDVKDININQAPVFTAPAPAFLAPAPVFETIFLAFSRVIRRFFSTKLTPTQAIQCNR